LRLLGAGFPLFGTQKYHKLGNQGATSLLPCLAILMALIPFILRRYGIELRRRSPWARIDVERGGEEDGKRDEGTSSTPPPHIE
jgi:hypothetical protein